MADSDQTGSVTQSRFLAANEPDAAEQARRKAVREALLEAAREDFSRIAKVVRNGYSEELERRAAEFTEDLQRGTGSKQAGVVMLDPNQFTAAVALGMDDEDAAKAVLEARGVKVDEEVISDAADSMRMSYAFRYGPERAFTQAPSAHHDYFTTDPQVCVIVPTSAYYIDGYRIEGMTRRENIDLINRHEGWHCLDTKYSLAHTDKAELLKIDGDKLDRALGNKAQLEILSIANHRESLADVGAVGDLIRNGANPKIIDALIAWRKPDDDPMHMSIASLQGLKADIEAMGVRRFRRMKEDEARLMYEDIVDANAASPKVMEAIIAYQYGTAEERQKIEEAAGRNASVAHALEIAASYDMRAPRNPNPPPKTEEKQAPAKVEPLTAEEQKLFEKLRQFDAVQLLQDRAFSEEKKITPETLAKAYGEMQEELRRKLDREPANPLYQAQATKLQESFVYVVQELDYVEANARRGVDIMKDPALKEFRFTAPETPATPSAPAPTPEAPQPETQARPAGAMSARAPKMG